MNAGVLILLLIGLQSASQGHPTLVQNLGIRQVNLSHISDEQRRISITADTAYINNGWLYLNEKEFLVVKTSGMTVITHSDPEGNEIKLTKTREGIKFSYNRDERQVTDQTVDELTESGEIAVIILSCVAKIVEDKFDETQVNFQARVAWLDCDKTQLSFGGGNSQAAARCAAKARRFLADHGDCVQVGSCDTSCIWDNHGCVSSAIYHCSGMTCASPLGICFMCGGWHGV